MDIFNFNHIDTVTHDETTLTEIKNLYKFYHRRWWCYKQTHKHLKRMNLTCKLSSSSLIATGAIAGGVTLNPIILGVISGVGLLVKTFTDYKNYDRRIEMSKFAHTTYEKVLVDLRSCLRGKQFDHDSFVSDIRLIDDMIIDLCPTISNRVEKRYEKKFNAVKNGTGKP